MNPGEIRDKLLKAVKQNKSAEYRSGYVDGVLDYAKETKDSANKPIPAMSGA